jgi:protein-tyrosine-phosphatase
VNVAERSLRFAALGDPIRLAIVDDLAASDRAPVELARRLGLASNLLAHHLSVLEEAGLVERLTSSGDRRRRYIRLRHDALRELTIGVSAPAGPVLFVCTHNSARSQLAAATWNAVAGSPASSAGTHPADRVHPGAVAAAERAGLDLSQARPRHLDDIDMTPALVVTVCDRAHEELEPGSEWLHWSISDPVEEATPAAFDAALRNVQSRIHTMTGGHEA